MLRALTLGGRIGFNSLFLLLKFERNLKNKSAVTASFAAVMLGGALLALLATAQDKGAAVPQISGFLGDYARLATAPDVQNSARFAREIENSFP
jgi:hypothetical protein